MGRESEGLHLKVLVQVYYLAEILIRVFKLSVECYLSVICE